jgi:hypothetical protein
MLHIPILRNGTPYESVEKSTLVHHATGEPVATMSIANSGMIVRDVPRMDDTVLEHLSTPELFDLCAHAAELFVSAKLPIGDGEQSFDDYINQLSATTGMPVSYCRNNASKIQKVMAEMDTVVGGLTRKFDLTILDRGYGMHKGGMLSYFRAGRIFGAVLPNNSPGVHSLWIPAIAMKSPIALKPGSEEPWSPLRIIEALAAAGIGREAFGFYPSDHAGAGELLRVVHRGMVFGDANTTRPWQNDHRIEVHGPGWSKVILGDDAVENWHDHIDVIADSIEANGGRSCINASAVWTPKYAQEIAESLGERLAARKALPADDPNATLAAFARTRVAEAINAAVDAGLREPGAEDVTERFRGSGRFVRDGRLAYLLPTIIHCDHHDHPLANREFLFPFASVIECPTKEMPAKIGQSLVVSAITRDEEFAESLMACADIDRLNIGSIPTFRLSWDQPHEGNLFELLYRQRAFQIESAA